MISKHWPFILALFVVSGLPLGALAVSQGWTDLSDKVYELVLLPWTAALLWGVQQRESGFQVSVLHSVWQGIRLTPRLLWYQILTGLALVASALCFVIPAIYVGVSISVGAALAIGCNRSADDAITQSCKLTRDYFWKLLAFWLALGAFLGAGALSSFALLESLEYSGFLNPEHRQGWPEALFEILFVSQFQAICNLAGLAALRQLLTNLNPEQEAEPIGLNPTQEVE